MNVAIAQQFREQPLPDSFQLEHGWTNADNAAFYENISLDAQMNFAELAGLSSHTDLMQIEDLIESADSVLEVGACYGRVLEFLEKYKNLNFVEVVERSSQFHEYLLDHHPNIVIHHVSILNFNRPKKFDLILWMWSGITDFNPFEQEIIIEKLYNLLSENGKLVIETCPHNQQLPSQQIFHNNYYYIERDKCHLFGYVPTPQKFEEYNKNISHKSLQHIQYTTPTKLKREIYIISR